MITVAQAKLAGVCRLCMVPIIQPSSMIWMENDDYPADKGERVTIRNGNEFAHSACADGDPPIYQERK